MFVFVESKQTASVMILFESSNTGLLIVIAMLAGTGMVLSIIGLLMKKARDWLNLKG